MRNIIIGVLVLIVVVGGVYLFARKPKAISLYPTNQNAPAQSPGSATTPVGQNMIAISNFAFSPQTLTVPVGTTVTWINQDTVGHQIKSDTFNSGLLNQGDTFQFTFSKAGTYNYSCAIHPSMTGTIVVK